MRELSIRYCRKAGSSGLAELPKRMFYPGGETRDGDCGTGHPPEHSPGRPAQVSEPVPGYPEVSVIPRISGW
ncbi:hypothetical protein EDC02_4596 [Micromonospora sp. Llam0]|nr:hypothetical protein EDC02_4596 [Micromonospora sp. Llam0]